MNYGLYLSASGLLTSLYRMDVVAGNLANSETPGYKSVVATTRQRDAAAIEDGLSPSIPSDRLLERLGAGVHLMPNRLDLRQGAPQETGRDLDVALQGDGFLVVSAGSENPSAVRFTRDGRLAISARGGLIHAASGRPMLDGNNGTITLAADLPVRIDRDGTVRQGETVVGRLQVATVGADAAASLRPAGDGLLAGPAGVMSRRAPGGASVIQGFVERSVVDPVKAMVEFAEAERAVGANTRMAQVHDQLLDRAINAFGRVI